MKKRFESAGLLVPRGRLVGALRSAQNFVKEVGYPIIIKPEHGVGASDTYKIENEQQLKDFFDYKDDVSYIMEEYIDKNIVTFDGLVDLKGDIVYYSSLVYNLPLLDVLDDNKVVYFYTQRKPSQQLIEVGTKAIDAFKIRGRFFHLELFDLGKDEYMPLELNCRPVGGYGLDTMNYANDIDLYEEYANIMTEQPFSKEITYPYYCAYIARRHYVNYRYRLSDLHYRYPLAIVQVSKVPDALSNLMGNQAVIVRHHSLAILKDMISDIVEVKND